jgi:hypothetical protein
LLYEHGFTIGGARQRLTDEGTIVDESAERFRTLVREMITDLEDLLAVLSPQPQVQK